MSDYVLEIAEFMHKMYKEVPVDTWQFLLVQGPKHISEAIEQEYSARRSADIVEARQHCWYDNKGEI